MKKLKRLLSTLIATSMLFSLAVFPSSGDADTRYEFEDGVALNSPTLHTDSTGAIGYMIKDLNQTVSVTVPVEEAGIYDIFISCLGSGGDSKQFTLNVNGTPVGNLSTTPGVADYTEVSTSAKLNAGDNIITISAAWTWFAVDYVRVAPAVLPDVTGSPLLSNPTPTAETQGLMNYLASIYTKHTLSGQQEIYNWGPHDFEWEFEWIKETTGKSPAIRAFDFLNYSNVCAGANTDEMYNFGYDDGTVDRMIDWANEKGGIVTASWHLTVPNDFANYTIGDVVDWENYTYKNDVSDFVAANVYVEGTKEYEFYRIALDKAAGGIQKLEDAGVPLIWRPLHEAQGGWFWWSGEGAEVFTNIWKYTYDYLVKEKGLDNLIWEWNGYAQADNDLWYPGDEYVDLVAFDKYNAIDTNGDWVGDAPNESAISATYYDLVKAFGQKMIAMAENDTVPSLANLTEEKAYWLYFCPWYESADAPFLTVMNDPETLTELYNSDYCITLDELPDWKNYEFGKDPDEGTETTTTTTGEQLPVLCGDVDLDGRVGTLTDVVTLAKYLSSKMMLPKASLANSDCDITESAINSSDLSALINYLLGDFDSLPVEMLPPSES
ncbi:MAG: beta-mannosidase [Oscillospiraceae bacterium]|jgi:mannan endo-1,4-beta-mannosidase|nr:beta-mannosidase [Oscillospiraceae bacterium]